MTFNQSTKHTLTKILAQVIILCVFFTFNAPFSSACSESNPAQVDITVQSETPCHTPDDIANPGSPDQSEDSQVLICNDCCDKCSHHTYNKSLLKSQLAPGFTLLLPKKLLPFKNNAYASLYLKPLTPPPTV